MRKIGSDDMNKKLKEKFFGKFLRKSIWKENDKTKGQAFKIALIYFIIGSLWILLSDKLLEVLVSNPDARTIIAIVKGWVYVLITAIMIYILIYNEIREVNNSKEKIQDINAILKEEIYEKTQIENELNKEKVFMEAIFNSIPGLVFLYDDKNNLVRWNKKHSEMTGFSNDELKSMNFMDWHKDNQINQEKVLKIIEVVTETGYGEIEIELPLKDGSKMPMFFTISSVKIENELYFTGIGLDITQRNQLIERLEKYKILAENANDAMLFVDKEGNILEVNDAAIRIYGYSFEDFTRMSVFDLRNVKKDTKVIEQMEEADASGIIFETIHYLRDGTPIPVEVSSQGTSIGDRRILLSIVRNISDRKKSENEILYLSYHDQLTGLYNRRFYEEEIRRINTENNIPISLIIADVNGLKLTNDAFGHKAGDILLKNVSNILKIGCPPNGVISRIGGDEFVILLPNTSENKTEGIIKRIKSAIVEDKSDNIVLSISMGASIKKNKFEDIDEIFKKAEANMYRDKLIESPVMRRKTIDLIMNSIYRRSSVEAVHGKKVSEICRAIAEVLKFENERVEQVELAGRLHDIGKISINESIINKPGSLNEDEWQEVRRHSEVGYQILRSVSEFSNIANFVLEHHERPDGKGYPKGLKGEEISIEGRIIAVADAYVSMISDKVYSKALSKENAVDELKKYSGSQFDPEIVKVLVEQLI
ncbi:HD domain-containing phosphohydrolase [Clostridium sp. C2-6-12]|uniref:HD domain-containing phosphohydrolase n=1 Tax=Clostridium sp. C2-6-12 TaxID=2698832 RepID=UPI001FAE2C18|nr:HD domain-containing phosphohydrolase [Clostridium sp. C2-6-12]